MSDPTPKAAVKRSKSGSARAVDPAVDVPDDVADWQRRVVGRSLRTATKRSIDRGATLINAAATLLERSNGEGFTVQEVANEAGQSLRTLYQYFESKDDLALAVFEEAMKRYARMIRSSIADLDDPLERLVGAVVAAASMPAHSSRGVDVGLARLRLKLSEAQPELVARSHEPVTLVFLELVQQAAAAGVIADEGDQATVYLIESMNASFIISQTLGNDYGLDLPDPERLARFCLQGLGADLPDGWYRSVTARLLPPEVSAGADWPGAHKSRSKPAAASAG
jgi:AcrR family transcriptional regulator